MNFDAANLKARQALDLARETFELEEAATRLPERPQPRPAPPLPASRILIISAAVGSGHDAVSRALAEQLGRAGAEVVIEDFYEAQLRGSSRVASAVNRVWLLRFGRTYQWVWDVLKGRGLLHWAFSIFLRVAYGGPMRRLVRKHHPDAVVATYPLCIPALAAMRRSGALGVPLISRITDFVAHPLWIADGVDLYLAATRESAGWLKGYGLSSPVHVAGIPIRDVFLSLPDRAAARTALGLTGDRPFALVTGGGDGVGHLDEIVRALDQLPIDLAVVCGRNDHLRRRAEALKSRARVVGYVHDMPLWLAAADVLVGTPGAISASEALCAATPILFYRPYLGQGIENALRIEGAGAGWIARRPAELEARFRQLLESPAALKAGGAAARRLADPTATAATAAEIESAIEHAIKRPLPRPMPLRPALQLRRRAATVALTGLAFALVVLVLPEFADNSLPFDIVQHVASAPHKVGLVIDAPSDPVSLQAVVDVLRQHTMTATVVTADEPQTASVRNIASAGSELGLIAPSGILVTPSGVRARLARRQQTLALAGVTAAVVLPAGNRYSWGSWVGSRGLRRVHAAETLDLQGGETTMPTKTRAGDVILIHVPPGALAAHHLAYALDNLQARGLAGVSLAHLLTRPA